MAYNQVLIWILADNLFQTPQYFKTYILNITFIMVMGNKCSSNPAVVFGQMTNELSKCIWYWIVSHNNCYDSITNDLQTITILLYLIILWLCNNEKSSARGVFCSNIAHWQESLGGTACGLDGPRWLYLHVCYFSRDGLRTLAQLGHFFSSGSLKISHMVSATE